MRKILLLLLLLPLFVKAQYVPAYPIYGNMNIYGKLYVKDTLHWTILYPAISGGGGWTLSGNTLHTTVAGNVVKVDSGIIDKGSARLLYQNTALQNLFGGQYCGINSSTGGANCGFGIGALQWSSDGFANAAFGDASLNNNLHGTANTSMGTNTMNYNVSGNSNSAFGSFSLAGNRFGSSNTSLGYAAGQLFRNSNSLFLGFYAGKYCDTTNSVDGTFYLGMHDFGTYAHQNTKSLLVGHEDATDSSKNWLQTMGSVRIGTTSSGSYQFNELGKTKITNYNNFYLNDTTMKAGVIFPHNILGSQFVGTSVSSTGTFHGYLTGYYEGIGGVHGYFNLKTGLPYNIMAYGVDTTGLFASSVSLIHLNEIVVNNTETDMRWGTYIKQYKRFSLVKGDSLYLDSLSLYFNHCSLDLESKSDSVKQLMSDNLFGAGLKGFGNFVGYGSPVGSSFTGILNYGIKQSGVYESGLSYQKKVSGFTAASAYLKISSSDTSTLMSAVRNNREMKLQVKPGKLSIIKPNNATAFSVDSSGLTTAHKFHCDTLIVGDWTTITGTGSLNWDDSVLICNSKNGILTVFTDSTCGANCDTTDGMVISVVSKSGFIPTGGIWEGIFTNPGIGTFYTQFFPAWGGKLYLKNIMSSSGARRFSFKFEYRK